MTALQEWQILKAPPSLFILYVQIRQTPVHRDFILLVRLFAALFPIHWTSYIYIHWCSVSMYNPYIEGRPIHKRPTLPCTNQTIFIYIYRKWAHCLFVPMCWFFFSSSLSFSLCSIFIYIYTLSSCECNTYTNARINGNMMEKLC